MRPHFKSVSLTLALISLGTAVLGIAPARSQWLRQTINPTINTPPPLNPTPIQAPNLNSTPIQIPNIRPPDFSKKRDVYQPSYTPSYTPTGPVLSREDRKRYKQWKQECKEMQAQYNSLLKASKTATAAGNLVDAENQLTQATQIFSFPTFSAPQFMDSCSLDPSQESNTQTLANVFALQAELLAQQNYLEAAVQKYQKALLWIYFSNPHVVLKLKAVLERQAEQFAEQGKLDGAIEKYRQLFLVDETYGSLYSSSLVNQNLGEQMLESQPLKAIAYFKIALSTRTSDNSELDLLLNLGTAYARIGHYLTSLSNYQSATFQARKLTNRQRELRAMLGQAQVYTHLGQHEQAFELYQQVQNRDRIDSLVTKNSQGTLVKVDTFVGFGDIWRARGKRKLALSYYNLALKIARSLGDSQRINDISNALSTMQTQSEALIKSQSQISTIIQQLNDALKQAISKGDISGEITALNQLGDQYSMAGQASQALNSYLQVLAKQIENDDFKGATETKEKIAVLLKENPKLASEFRDTMNPQLIRKLIGMTLDRGQQCFAFSLADFLKIAEAKDYLGNQRNIQKTAKPAQASQSSTSANTVLQAKAIEPMQELEQLQQIPEANRTPQQWQRLEELKFAATEMFELFAQFLSSDAVADRLADTNRNSGGETVQLNTLCPSLEIATKQQKQKVAFFYPLLLNDDRLALMLYIPSIGPEYRMESVSRDTLTQEVKEFQKAILARNQDFNLPNSAMRQSAQQLYHRLLEPFAPDLKAANVQTIIYASDDILRYVPLAALHTGSHWLIEDYAIQSIVASSITNFNTLPQRDRRVLAGAFTKGQVTVPFGKQRIAYTGLPHAKTEVDALKVQIPNTTELFDHDFTAQGVLDKASQYTLMHFATHASFGGTPDDSYIVFGKGYSTLRDMGNWNLKHIDLLTLSACATAFGTQLSDGREVLGLGYQIHRAGAKAVLASLWAVQDDSTQMLMDRFYTAFVQGKSKVAAIRQAQLDLLSGNAMVTAPQQGKQTAIKESTTPGTPQRFDHPYYWAPFILIGNGL